MGFFLGGNLGLGDNWSARGGAYNVHANMLLEVHSTIFHLKIAIASSSHRKCCELYDCLGLTFAKLFDAF